GAGALPAAGSRRVLSRWRACWAAFIAASCSAFSAAARASAAATSMSWALVGLTTGDGGDGGVGRGGPGTGERFSAPPDEGRRGGAGLAADPPGAERGVAGAGDAGAA